MLNYAAAARFAALAARAFARFATIAAFRAGDIVFFGPIADGAFFEAGGAFLAPFAFAPFAALAFLRWAVRIAFAAAESFRLGFAGTGVATGAEGSESPLILAHLALCPSAILRLAAAEIFRFGGAPSDGAAGAVGPPVNSARSSAI